MQNAYQPELWHEAFIVLGGGAAALAGLIIVAASVRADQIMAMPHWRVRARNSTMSMISVTISSILILLPQDVTALGIELIVFNLGCAVLLPAAHIYQLIRNHIHAAPHVPILAVTFYLIAAAGGAGLIVGRGGGMYLVTLAYAMYLLLAPYNAYMLLLPHDRASETRRNAPQ